MALTESIKRNAVSTTSRDSYFHPEAWRSKIKQIRLRAAPMLAVMKSMGSEKTESFHYHWAVQPFATGRGTITEVYAADGTEYVTADDAAADGAVLTLVMSEANASQIIATDVLTVINGSTKNMVRFYVQGVTLNGASSRVSGILLEADTSKDLLGSTAIGSNYTLYFTITGNAQEELSALPTPLYAEPTWFENVTQNFMESMELSNREIKEKERVQPNIRIRNRLQAYQRLMRKKELSYMFGKYKVTTGTNGRRLTFTNGIVTAIQTHESGNVFNYATDTTLTSTTGTWATVGKTFIDLLAEKISRKGEAPYKTCYLGGLGLTYINQLVDANTSYQVTGRENVYGLNVTHLRTPNQDWRLIEHPLFSEDPALRTSMLVTEKHLVKEKVFQPLKHIPADGNARDGYNYVSGIKEGYECDTGIMYENLEAMAWVTNLGSTRS